MTFYLVVIIKVEFIIVIVGRFDKCFTWEVNSCFIIILDNTIVNFIVVNSRNRIIAFEFIKACFT